MFFSSWLPAYQKAVLEYVSFEYWGSFKNTDSIASPPPQKEAEPGISWLSLVCGPYVKLNTFLKSSLYSLFYRLGALGLCCT